jgi:hypothetical protein
MWRGPSPAGAAAPLGARPGRHMCRPLQACMHACLTYRV